MDEATIGGATSAEMGELGAEPQLTVIEGEKEYKNVLTLKHPIKINAELVTALQYDFEALTAKDLHEVSKYLKGLGIPVSVPALDYEYQLVTFHKAVRKKMAQVSLADLMRLQAADAMKGTALARDFLLDMDPGQKELGSEKDSDESSSN